MEENTYKNLELQIDCADNERAEIGAEYLIVQDNGTFSIPFGVSSDNRTDLHPILTHNFRLINNHQSSQLHTAVTDKELKYVTQVQNVKEVLENNKYNISQQYYVDVDTSTQFVSVNDNELVLSEETSNNAYSHSYLLHSLPESSEIQTSDDNELEQSEIDNGAETDIDPKLTQTCTEITLDEEQCHNLEKNGWVILEFNEKVHLLNADGLHDITKNNDLIQQYKENSENISKRTVTHCASMFEEAISNEKPETKRIYLIQEEVPNSRENYPESSVSHGNQEHINSQDMCISNDNNKTDNTEQESLIKKEQKNSKYISYTRLKTNLTLKDIPYKIRLGKTRKRKKLIAKILSIDNCNTNINANDENDTNKKTNNNSACIEIKTLPNNCPQLENILELARHTSVSCGDDDKWCTVEDISAAEEIVARLLQVPGSREMLWNRNVILTKIVNISNTIPEGIETRLRPVVVGGRVSQFAPEGGWHFVYLPDMLPDLLKDTENDADEFEMSASGSPLRRQRTPRDGYLLHGHVALENSSRAAVTLVKRRLPLKLRSQTKTSNLACSICGKVFEIKEQLYSHQVSCLHECKDIIYLNELTNSSEQSECEYNMTNAEDSNPRKKKKSQLHACSGCASIFQTEDELKVHQKEGCTIDENIVKNNSDQQHNKALPVEGYVCTHCKKQFNRLANYRKHLSTHCIKNNKKECMSNECSVETDCKMKCEGLHKCNVCLCSYYHAATLSRHIKSTHINITDSEMN